MGRATLPLALLAAAAVLGAAAWLLLGGRPEAPAPVRPPDPPPPAARTVRVREVPPEEAPPAEEEPGPAPEPPPAPGSYPWEVPAWWNATDEAIRSKELHIDDQVLPVARQVERIAAAAGVAVRLGPEIAAWGEETRIALPGAHGTARSILDTLALRTNLEPVLGKDEVVLHLRAKVPDDRATRASRVQSALRDGAERRAGKRLPDPGAGDFEAEVLDLGFEDVPLRAALDRVGEATGLPAWMDRACWDANPRLRIPREKRTLAALLDLVAAAAGAAWDVTPRRIVLFRAQ